MTQIITKVTCKQGVVEQADDIIHLTKAKSDSNGIVIINKDKALYIPNDITDRQDTIDQLVNVNKQLIELCTDIVTVITPIATAMTIPIPGQSGLPTGLIAGFTGGTDFANKVSNIQTKLNQITTDCNDLKTHLK